MCVCVCLLCLLFSAACDITNQNKIKILCCWEATHRLKKDVFVENEKKKKNQYSIFVFLTQFFIKMRVSTELVSQQKCNLEVICNQNILFPRKTLFEGIYWKIGAQCSSVCEYDMQADTTWLKYDWLALFVNSDSCIKSITFSFSKKKKTNFLY